MSKKLQASQIQEALQTLSGWTQQDSCIEKKYCFEDFTKAFAFMTAVAIEAEKLNHHPEWSNVYNRVNVRLTTHDSGGLTRLDFDLAAKMDSLAGSTR